MWQVTSTGSFLSCVRYDPTKDFSKTSPFREIATKKGTHILVRARVKEHIEDLRHIVKNLVVDDQPTADYRWRAVVTKKQLKKYQAYVVDNIDYDSHFKEACRAKQPEWLKSSMYSAMMATWGNFARLQATKPYTGQPRGTSAKGWASKKERDESRDFLGILDGAKKVVSSQLTFGDFPAPKDNKGKPITLKDAKFLFYAQGNKVQLTSDQFDLLTNEAFDLYTNLQEKFGVGTKLTREQIEKEASALAPKKPHVWSLTVCENCGKEATFATLDSNCEYNQAEETLVVTEGLADG